jgi:Pre ATP-grasp domain
MCDMKPILSTYGDPGTAHVFIHHVTGSHRDPTRIWPGGGHLHRDQRAFLLARRDDVVCVLGKMEPAYVEFLSMLGLGLERDHLIEVADDSRNDRNLTLTELLLRDSRALQTIGNLVSLRKRIVLNPYFMSRVELELASKLASVIGKPVEVAGGNPKIVECANLKHHVHLKAEELGVPVAPGELVALPYQSDGDLVDVAPLREAIDRHIHETGRVVVRKSDGAAGRMILLEESSSGNLDVNWITDKGPQDSNVYLVQVLLDATASPNIQMYVEPSSGAISCVGITEQRLDANLAHEGNVFPSDVKTSADMIRSAQTLAKWLRSEDYAGLVGFDFVEYVHPRTGRHDFILAEINARTNGSAYPLALMERLNESQARDGRPLIKALLSVKVSSRCTSFSEMEEHCGALFFDPETGSGAVPYNTGCLPYGMCEVAFLGNSMQVVKSIYEAFAGMSQNLVNPT